MSEVRPSFIEILKIDLFLKTKNKIKTNKETETRIRRFL